MIKGLLTLILGANTTGLDKALGRSGRNLKRLTKLTELAKGAIIGFGAAAVIALGVGVVNTIIDFDKAMVGLSAILRVTRDDIKNLEEQAISLGGSTIFTANQVGELQTILARFGFDQGEIEDSTAAILDLAAAAGIDVATAADTGASTLRAFGLEASEMGRVADTMTNAFTKSALTVDTFAQSMVFAAPLAAAAGSSIEETSAALAILADNGIRGSIAGTGLRRIFTNLAKEGKSLSDIFEDASKSMEDYGDDLGFAKDAVGQFALSSFLVLAKHADKLKEVTQEMGEVGSAAAVAETQLGSIANQLLILESAWRGLILTFESGEGVFGTLFKAAISHTTEFLNILKQFGDFSFAGITSSIDDVGEFVIKTANPFAFLTNVLIESAVGMSKVEAEALALKEALEDTGWTAAAAAPEIQDFYNGVEEGVSSAYAALKEAEAKRNEELAKKAQEQIKIEEDLQKKLAKAFEDQNRKEIEGLYDVSVVLDQVTGKYREILTLKERIADKSLEGLAKGSASGRARDADVSGVSQTGELRTTPTGTSFSDDPVLGPLIADSIRLAEANEAIADSYAAIGKSIAGALSQGAQSLEDFKVQAINALIDIATQYAINAAIAAVTAGAQSASGAGPLALIVLPAAIALAAGLVKTALNSARSNPVTAFADGGIVSGPTYGLMGEYAGASRNPEVIAPLSDLKGMMGASEVEVTGEFVIKGRNLVAMVDKENNRMNKYGA